MFAKTAASMAFICASKKTGKFQFIYLIPNKSCIFKVFRLCNSQTLFIFPCFSLTSRNKGNFLLFAADYLIQQSCGSTLRFPCSVSVDIHCGTNVSVSKKLLHILWCCPI